MDIHRCRFVPYPSSTINALAFSHSSTPNLPSKGPPTLRLAVGRANGDIEIWNPQKGAWYQESILRGGKGRSIEGLVWTQDSDNVDKHGRKTSGKLRLFSIGYSTAVTEWDLALGRPLRHSSGNHGEIWCMAVQPKDRSPKTQTNGANEVAQEEEDNQSQKIAVGCADGSVILLNTADEDLRFSRVLARPAKKKTRVLSITFQDHYTIIAGHADSTIRIYDVRSRQPMRNMTLGAGPKGGPKETLVWSVKCLKDGTIVSGDSTGVVTFWDGRTYSLLQRITGHAADILDLAVSADGQSVFSGGMDRRTTMYRRTGNEKLRWAKLAHQRFHRHDVKAMATFETKSMSVLASGGPDTAPLIVPIQEFGRENHRTLSTLPQTPILKSSVQTRLIVSWWDREIRIWRISRSQENNSELDDRNISAGPKGRKLAAKIALQGEESITSVDLSRNGNILAVSTQAAVKLFRLRTKDDNVKVQTLQTSSATTKAGAKSVIFSPDQRWLAIIRSTDDIELLRITEGKDPKKIPQFLSKSVRLKRLHRSAARSHNQHESLGNYKRSIIRLAFSSDSRICVVGDLSGWLDSWVLEGHENLSQVPNEADKSARSSVISDDEESDDDANEERHPAVIFGQHWIRNPSASLLIKLPAAPLILSFRPSSTQSNLALTNGNPGVHPTRLTPNPHSHDLPEGEDRLLILTAENQLYEINVLSGKLSDWSRSNPTSSLPLEFRSVRDRAMGAIWDVQRHNQRIWLYGVSWLWMFDFSRNMPAPEHQDDEFKAIGEVQESGKSKRKRAHDSDDERFTARSRHDTGAGSRKALSELALGIGPKIRKYRKGPEDKEEIIESIPGREYPSDEDDGTLPLVSEYDSALMSLRPDIDGKEQQGDNGSDIAEASGDVSDVEERHVMRRKSSRPSHWHTYKYRPILGIVPIGGDSDDEAETQEGKDDSDNGSAAGLEVVLVERPLWDIDLPPQFYGDQEWNP
ncbi:U3 small nucleolar RNA-associated protein [Lecanora helva]